MRLPGRYWLKKKKKKETPPDGAVHRATSSRWQRPDPCLEHLRHIGEEGGNVEHLWHVIIVREEASGYGSKT
jgi:hypothetical protein